MPDGFSYTEKDGLNKLSIEYLPVIQHYAVVDYVESKLGVHASSVMYFDDDKLDDIFEHCDL